MFTDVGATARDVASPAGKEGGAKRLWGCEGGGAGGGGVGDSTSPPTGALARADSIARGRRGGRDRIEAGGEVDGGGPEVMRSYRCCGGGSRASSPRRGGAIVVPPPKSADQNTK